MPSRLTDRVREYAVAAYVEPARARHETRVCILVRDIQKALRLNNRTPLVCQALRGNKFLEENHLEIEKVEGPPSGQSTTVRFTYRLLQGIAAQPRPPHKSSFLELRGLAKDLFQSLGGGEAFIRGEREQFHPPEGNS